MSSAISSLAFISLTEVPVSDRCSEPSISASMLAVFQGM
jgi:hypothetical protein